MDFPAAAERVEFGLMKKVKGRKGSGSFGSMTISAPNLLLYLEFCSKAAALLVQCFTTALTAPNLVLYLEQNLLFALVPPLLEKRGQIDFLVLVVNRQTSRLQVNKVQDLLPILLLLPFILCGVHF